MDNFISKQDLESKKTWKLPKFQSSEIDELKKRLDAVDKKLELISNVVKMQDEALKEQGL